MANVPLSSLLGNALNISGGVLGSVFYQNAPNVTLTVAPNTTTTRKYLMQQGTGSAGAAPDWASIDAADIQSGTLNIARSWALTGDVTSTAGSSATTIAAGAVTLAKMANVATGSVFYRRTAGTGVPEVQTLATLKSDLGLSGTNSGDQTTISGNAGSATVLQTARTINGTSFNGSASITTATWGTARTITIGSTGKSIDGSANVSWSLAEIGAIATGASATLDIVSTSRLYAGWDSGIVGSISCNNWFRSSGQTGIYFSDYVGGWYMTDTTYVRSYNNKAVAASDFVISSDRRLKTAVTPLVYRGRIDPVSFYWIKEGTLDLGFIADQVEQLYPEVIGTIDGEDAEGNPTKIKQLSYQKLTAVLAAQINGLEDTVTELRGEVAELKQLVLSLLNK